MRKKAAPSKPRASLVLTLHCGHPDCSAQLVLPLAGGFGSIRERPNLPEGWWWHNETLQACPAHAKDARAETERAYEWATRTTAALNIARRQVRRDHPVPKHVAWLGRVWTDREDEIG